MPFFRCAVNIGRDDLTVPVELLGRVGVVVNLYRDRSAFFEPQERSGELAVVGDCGDDVLRRDLNRSRGNAQNVIGRSRCGLSGYRHKIG